MAGNTGPSGTGRGCDHKFVPYEVLPVPHNVKFKTSPGLVEETESSVLRTKSVKCAMCGKMKRLDRKRKS